MTVTVDVVAAELRRRLPNLGDKKLHKLLYYCQGHHLADLGEPLYRESLSAWDMGPVVGELWRRDKDGLRPGRASALSDRQLATVGFVVSRYGRLSGDQLEAMTHAEPPWQDADRGRPSRGSAPIPQDALRSFFRSMSAGADSPPRSVLEEWLGASDHPHERSREGDTRETLLARLPRA